MSAVSTSHRSRRPAPESVAAIGDWKFRILGSLSGTDAPRIITAAQLHALVCQVRPGTSASTARLLAHSLIQADALRRVTSGVYLNLRCRPPAELTEMAPHVRTGAVVSLQSVLGECGFLNNPSAIVMAVVPTSAHKRPNLGEVTTSGGDVFRFYGLAERFFPSCYEDRWALYQPGRPCDMFRPEAALLQWLYLAALKRSTVTPPPRDVDMSTLDDVHLNELARRWQLQVKLKAWHDDANAMGYGEQQHNLSVNAGTPSQAKSTAQGEAARARLLARLPKAR